MTIHDDVLRPRIPRLGTITTGRGVEATSRAGNAYSRPTKAKSLVFHTDDGEVAAAVQSRFGGVVLTDSPSWGYDVVTAGREAELLILPGGFRQALELWRAAECLRRCDGIVMSTLQGRPVSRGCLCDEEMARGEDRACRPTTVMPAVVELDVERFGVWEVRSNSWGTASGFKGVLQALAMVGAGAASVPAVLSMVDRTVRDTKGAVHDVVEFQLTIARSHRALGELASKAAGELGAAPLPELGSGESRRLALMERWAELQLEAHRLGLREQLKADWRGMFAGRGFEDLTVEELSDWLALVDGSVVDARAILAEEGSSPRVPETVPPSPPPPDDEP
jgi:hypothetical protein